MNPLRSRNVDRACERRGYRGNKDRKASILELFDDKRRKKAFVAFKEGGLPDLFLIRTGQLLGETPD